MLRQLRRNVANRDPAHALSLYLVHMNSDAPNKENAAAVLAKGHAAGGAGAGEGHALRELVSRRALGDLAHSSDVADRNKRARKPKGAAVLFTIYADLALRRRTVSLPNAPAAKRAAEPLVQDALPNSDESLAAIGPHPWREVRCQTLGAALRKRPGVAALRRRAAIMHAEPPSAESAEGCAIRRAEAPDRAPVPSPLRYPLRRSNAA